MIVVTPTLWAYHTTFKVAMGFTTSCNIAIATHIIHNFYYNHINVKHYAKDRMLATCICNLMWVNLASHDFFAIQNECVWFNKQVTQYCVAPKSRILFQIL